MDEGGHNSDQGPTAQGGDTALFQRLCDPVLAEIRRQAAVTDHLMDTDAFQVLIATIWANIVSDPGSAGLREDQLEGLHDFLNQQLAETLGPAASLRTAFRFVASPPGEQAMARLKVDRAHRNLLFYFASMILDPDGHRARMEEQGVLR